MDKNNLNILVLGIILVSVVRLCWDIPQYVAEQTKEPPEPIYIIEKVEVPVNVEPEIVYVETIKQEATPLIEYTSEDYKILVRCIMSECGGETYACKLGVGQTIINRVLDENYPNNITSVITAPNQYSTHNNGEPNLECYMAAMEVLFTQPYPTDLFWFRAGHYHSIGHPYMHYGNTYFSTKENYGAIN